MLGWAGPTWPVPLALGSRAASALAPTLQQIRCSRPLEACRRSNPSWLGGRQAEQQKQQQHPGWFGERLARHQGGGGGDGEEKTGVEEPLGQRSGGEVRGSAGAAAAIVVSYPPSREFAPSLAHDPGWWQQEHEEPRSLLEDAPLHEDARGQSTP